MIEKEELEEGNKLISDFMGEYTADHDEWVYGDKKLVPELLYHSSWDWIIPVFKKCIEEQGRFTWTSFYYELETLDIERIWRKIVYYLKNTQRGKNPYS